MISTIAPLSTKKNQWRAATGFDVMAAHLVNLKFRCGIINEGPHLDPQVSMCKSRHFGNTTLNITKMINNNLIDTPNM